MGKQCSPLSFGSEKSLWPSELWRGPSPGVRLVGGPNITEFHHFHSQLNNSAASYFLVGAKHDFPARRMFVFGYGHTCFQQIPVKLGKRFLRLAGNFFSISIPHLLVRRLRHSP